MNFYKIRIPKLFTYLVIDATFTSDHLLHFGQNLLERIQKT